MAIYLSRKKGGVTPTSITPSNSSPAALTANTAVTPTTNGYAIESYLDVYPDNDYPAQIASDVVVVFKGAGHVIEDAPITAIPNDNNPPELDEECIYIIRNNTGYLYETQPATPTSITPNNSSPVALTTNTPVKPTESGYAIKSYANKNPSDSSPASVSSGAIIKASASGYLYASSGLGKCKAGTFTSSTSAQTITLGFQPKYILIMSTALTTNIYNSSYNASKAVYATSSAGATEYTISGNTSNNHISAISSTGFTFNKSGSSGTTIYYFAVG